MPLHRPSLYFSSILAIVLPAMVVSTASLADVWVFEPSAAIDQRFDDNYTIDQENPDPTIATRLVGTLGLSREAPNAKYAGLLRVDGLITSSDSRGEELNSNGVAFLSSQFTTARSEYGIGLNFKIDTPSRDISADLTDIASVAADTQANVTQDQNVARQRWALTPNWRYNLTRLTTFETDLSITSVTHELPSAEEALRAEFALGNPGVPIPDPISPADVIGGPGFVTVTDELDDFTEAAINIGIKSKLSPITTISFFAGYSDFTAEVEPDTRAIFRFDDLAPDEDNMDVRRKPKRQRRSNTAQFRIGYDRALTPTLSFGVQGGMYFNKTDDTDLLRLSDAVGFDEDGMAFVVVEGEGDEEDTLIPTVPATQEQIDELVTDDTGFLANITVSKNTGITRYSGKFGVDVLPSDVGSQVESLELIGDLYRQLGPLLDFSFRVRAYEPDALNAESDEEFSRRFLSLEPKLIWRFSRAWTVAGSYRYRRQKSQAAERSGESNALLFSLKYTPPSAIRDAQLNDG